MSAVTNFSRGVGELGEHPVGGAGLRWRRLYGFPGQGGCGLPDTEHLQQRTHPEPLITPTKLEL